MQAIQTKYLPATNHKPTRIKAFCERGQITVSYQGSQSGEACHVWAVDQLIAKFNHEDERAYGPNAITLGRGWNAPRVCGGLPDGSMVHVFINPNHA